MKQKVLSVPITLALLLSLTCSAFAAGAALSPEAAGAYLQERGIYQGDDSGNLMLDKSLTRAELAVILTRLNGNPEHIAAEAGYYAGQCSFPDVPDWARPYVGFCAVNGYMVGYGNGTFGGNDPVTPAAACTVVLRIMEHEPGAWDYATACQTAVELGLTNREVVSGDAITRGDLAVMLCQGLYSDTSNGAVSLPADGSRYVPQVGDVISCTDGTSYTITDVSRWDANAFAEGPLGELPSPTCDWSLLDQPTLPEPEARHYTIQGKEYCFVRNIYETRRMLYTLYNAVGANPATWKDGGPVLSAKGNQLVRFSLTIPTEETPYSFWPWKEDNLVSLFNSCPPGTYYLEAWDVYKDGVFQKTEYDIKVK